MRKNKKLIIFSTIIIAALLSTNLLYAKRRVISDADIIEDQGCAVIMVRFNFPVRYKRHFPQEAGDELSIQFEPITIGSSDSEDRFDREEVWFSPDETIPLSEVIFEGNIAGGPFLTLTFQREIAFKVEPGTDFRSLIITPFQDKEGAECFPAN